MTKKEVNYKRQITRKGCMNCNHSVRTGDRFEYNCELLKELVFTSAICDKFDNSI